MSRDCANSREHIDWLLDRGVDVNKTDHLRTDTGARPGQCHDYSLKILNNVAANGDIAFFDYLVTTRGADPHRSLALHCASKCTDPLKTTAMIHHLLDVHHMQIEADNEELRDFFHFAGDSGTQLNCAVFYQNLPALLTLLDRGANASRAVYRSMDNVLIEAWLPALGPLLDAGADPNNAFEYAVDHLNFEAAKLCLQKGADPTRVLRKQQVKAAKKASGSFDRQLDEVHGDGGYSSDDDVDLAVQRKAMRCLVSSASNERDQQHHR